VSRVDTCTELENGNVSTLKATFGCQTVIVVSGILASGPFFTTQSHSDSGNWSAVLISLIEQSLLCETIRFVSWLGWQSPGLDALEVPLEIFRLRARLPFVRSNTF
jgi:hypothetical protein